MAITERRLTAILAADVCDFSRMMGENEDRTIKNLRTCRELIESSISSHKGNIFNTAGDSIVAVSCTELSIDDWWRRWSGSNGVVGDKIGQGLAELGLLGL